VLTGSRHHMCDFLMFSDFRHPTFSSTFCPPALFVAMF
jgi:hypothetical protein